MMQRRYRLVAALLVTLLTGCGGGSSSDLIRVGGTAVQPPTPVPPPAATGKTEAVYNAGTNNQEIDPLLDPSNGQPTASSPDLQGSQFAFSVTSPDLEGSAYDLPAGLASPSGALFAPASYAGAFSQDTQDNWTEGWTVGLNGNLTVWEPVGTPAASGTCPAGTTDIGDQALPASVGGGSMDLCQLPPRFDTTGTVTLTADNIYRLRTGFPGTYVGNGECEIGVACQPAAIVAVTLVIEAGTLILGDAAEALIVTRGSKIEANGTAADPIVMTSVDQFTGWVAGGDGDSGRGEWAGLALMGYSNSTDCASQAPPCNVNAEGSIGFYGGSNDADDSGALNYVVIVSAGNDIDGLGNELNGLTMFGTGSATTASFVQVHKGLDDGIEHFGATDFIDHLVLTDNGDDSFDWGQGYRGGAQFVVIKLAVDTGDKGIEADNDEGDNDKAPRSAPVLANFTIIGRNDGVTASGGVLLRRGTGARLYNFVVVDFRDACLDVDDAATAQQFGTGLTIANSVLWCPFGSEFKSDSNVGAAEVEAWYNAGPNNQVINPNLTAPAGVPNPAGTGTSNFVATDYVGAFAQDTTDNWTEGWTVGVNGNNTVWEPASGGSLGGAVPTATGTCPTGTTDIGDQDLSKFGGGAMDICQLAARYATNGAVINLTNNNIYRLATGFPGTYIGNGECEIGTPSCPASGIVQVTLRIEAGTLLLGNPAEALTITRGSRIEAQGSAVDPIVMTSVDQFEPWAAGTSDGTSGRGEWAGLALMGFGDTNDCGPSPCNVNAEGSIGFYGGDRADDDSGFLAYVVIRQAGNDINGQGDELNGLTLFGTGSGTRISYVQVHQGLDDGVEHFGSSDFMDHIVLTENADDSFDWGQGYLGGVQFMLVIQASDAGDRAIEADNNENDPNAAPVSAPTIANMTLIGQTGRTGGILLRRGTGALIYNSITAYSDVCLSIQGAATFAREGDGRLVLENEVVSCPTNFRD